MSVVFLSSWENIIMRSGWTPVTAGLLAGLFLGCGERGSNTPLATDGANQVVIKVPGMT